MRSTSLALVLGGACLLGGCKGNSWILGSWLLLTEEGKPGVCHEFKKDKELVTYSSTECAGNPDTLLSGKYDFKADDKVAIQRGNDLRAKMALITAKEKDSFVAQGALSGSFFRVGEKGPAEVLAMLDGKGLIKFKPVPPSFGCRQLSVPLPVIRSLAKEKEPRMLRQKDQTLEYRVNQTTEDPMIEKVVYAMGHESIEWIALHLAPAAFAAPDLRSRLEQGLGKAGDIVTTGTGEKRQDVLMWRAYCTKVRETPNKDVDLTLFVTPGQKRGTLYVSEQVLSSLWEDLKLLTKDPAAQATEVDEGGEEEAPPAAPTPPPAAPAVKAPAPIKAPPGQAAPPKAEPPADDDDI